MRRKDPFTKSKVSTPTLFHSLSLCLSFALALSSSLSICFWSLCCLFLYSRTHTITFTHIHIKNIRMENIFETHFQSHFTGSRIVLIGTLSLDEKKINKCIAYSFSRDVKNWNNFWRNFGRLYLFDWHFFLKEKKKMMYNNFIKLLLFKQKHDEEGGKKFICAILKRKEFFYVYYIHN